MELGHKLSDLGSDNSTVVTEKGLWKKLLGIKIYK